MFLQNYDYKIKHRSEERMFHVDALSHCNSILVLEANTCERTFRQDKNEEIYKIQDKLESAKDKFYELKNGLMYRKFK